MRACVQRVVRASVDTGGETVASIGPGLLVFLCVEKGDDENILLWIRDKILSLRIFRNGDKHMDFSLKDTGGSALIISQFTLAADVSKGRRPDFTGAMEPKPAKVLYEKFLFLMQESLGVDKVGAGVFGADMEVALVNDGPVTLILEKRS